MDNCEACGSNVAVRWNPIVQLHMCGPLSVTLDAPGPDRDWRALVSDKRGTNEEL